MTAENGPAMQQVVFVDAAVPDLRDLLNGLLPGVEAFVLNQNSDGIDQIAANGLSNFSSNSIVGHASAGQMQFGSAAATDASLARDRNALSEIGAALASGGARGLYGFVVAQGAAGVQFVADLSDLAAAAVFASDQHIGRTPAARTGPSMPVPAALARPAVARRHRSRPSPPRR